MSELFLGQENRAVPRTPWQELVFRQFGGNATMRTTIVPIGAAPTTVLKQNAARLSWLIQNLSASDIRVGFNQEIAVGTGLLLVANSGLISSVIHEDGLLTGWPVYGVGPAAGLNVYVVELFLYTVRG